MRKQPLDTNSPIIYCDGWDYMMTKFYPKVILTSTEEEVAIHGAYRTFYPGDIISGRYFHDNHWLIRDEVFKLLPFDRIRNIDEEWNA